jgi:large subunit ribosomal protein L15
MPYKRGFTNIWRTEWETINIGRLAELGIEGPITPEVLAERGVIRGTEFPLKVLGHGELAGAVSVKAHAFSKSAQQAIENAGGSVETLERNDKWTSARPRSRRLPLNREMKAMRVGKVGGPSRREAMAQLQEREAKET